jgi:hypothetical protein
LVALLFTGACDDEENSITGPPADTEWPSVVVTSAPAESRADHEVALEFTVTDDVALSMVTVNWGAPDDPVEMIPVEGKSFSGTCVHTFSATGRFTIVVQVRDTSGRVSTVRHDISITAPPPEAPLNVAVEVANTRAVITWTPGTWAAGHEIAVNRIDSPEPIRVQTVADGGLASWIVTGLAWDASYTVTVSALNAAGKAESSAVGFQTPPPNPAKLTRFGPVAADPTCLVLEWSLGAAAENYRVELRGDTDGDSFDVLVSNADSEAEFCANAYPIVDGMTYTAQVFSVLGDKEYGSNTLEYTVVFNPPAYWATGSWTATWVNAAGETEILSLQLEDDDGVITGSWECDIFTSEPSFVTGTRTWAVIDLTLHFVCDGVGYCPPNPLVGEFRDADTIEAQLGTGWFDLPLTLTRD